MLRVVVRLPSRRGARRASSQANQQLVQRQRAADSSLADRFNLAQLNGGKNPFETASERLLRSQDKKPKNESDMRDLYSLNYLMGQKKPKVKVPTEKVKKNPFDVASSKLM